MGKMRKVRRWNNEGEKLTGFLKRTAGTRRVMKVLMFLSGGCFLSQCLFWEVNVTQGHTVQVPVCCCSISDLCPLSLPLTV